MPLLIQYYAQLLPCPAGVLAHGSSNVTLRCSGILGLEEHIDVAPLKASRFHIHQISRNSKQLFLKLQLHIQNHAIVTAIIMISFFELMIS
jgi:hypothetical protein